LDLSRVAGVVEEVGVDVERDRHARVAEDAADLRDIEPEIDDQVASERVAKVMEAQRRPVAVAQPGDARGALEIWRTDAGVFGATRLAGAPRWARESSAHALPARRRPRALVGLEQVDGVFGDPVVPARVAQDAPASQARSRRAWPSSPPAAGRAAARPRR
jgi:hypothetical protein